MRCQGLLPPSVALGHSMKAPEDSRTLPLEPDWPREGVLLLPQGRGVRRSPGAFGLLSGIRKIAVGQKPGSEALFVLTQS